MIRINKCVVDGPQDFLGKTQKNYKAELESVDFKGSSEVARVNINTWVEEQTQGGSYTLTYTLISILIDLHV